jgi:hypothetical protein
VEAVSLSVGMPIARAARHAVEIKPGAANCARWAEVLDALVVGREMTARAIAEALDAPIDCVLPRRLARMRDVGILGLARTERNPWGGQASNVWTMSELARGIVSQPRGRWDALIRRHLVVMSGKAPTAVWAVQDAILVALRERPGQRAIDLKGPAGEGKATYVARRLMRMRRDGLVRREVGADGYPRWYAAEAWS